MKYFDTKKHKKYKKQIYIYMCVYIQTNKMQCIFIVSNVQGLQIIIVLKKK